MKQAAIWSWYGSNIKKKEIGKGAEFVYLHLCLGARGLRNLTPYTHLKGTYTIKEEKNREKQKLSPEIGKFSSLQTEKREVMWICIVVVCWSYSNSCWLVALTHAAFMSNVPSILPERGHVWTDFTRISLLFRWVKVRKLEDSFQQGLMRWQFSVAHVQTFYAFIM